jgi:histidinol-phosphatase (PHP family)
MKIDYHTHHVRCGHAVGTLEEYVQRGIAIGLEQLGVSDHMPLLHVDPATYFEGMAMPMEELPYYYEEAMTLKQKYKGQIDIRVGLEGDYIEGYEEQIEKIVTGYEWDYVIGSCHFLGEWDISDFRQLAGWEGKDRYAVYEQYYDAIGKAAKTGFYDFIGHVDVIKRFEFKPEQDTFELVKTALDIISENKLAIELNASGLRTPVKEMFPSRRVLEYAITREIPITIGSDAHHPDKLCNYFDQAIPLLKELGVKQLATFAGRRRTMVDF